MGVCIFSMFCCTFLYVHSSFAIILMGKRKLVVFLVWIPGVSWWLCGSSSRSHGFDCGLWLWYFLIILTHYFWWVGFTITEDAKHVCGYMYMYVIPMCTIPALRNQEIPRVCLLLSFDHLRIRRLISLLLFASSKSGFLATWSICMLPTCIGINLRNGLI